MRTRTKMAIAAAALAATVYAWKWRQNYVFNQAHAHLREEIPEDAAGALDLLEYLDELAEFEGIAAFTCMEPCCYEPIDEDIELGVDPDEE